jgi:hypothetical protein
MQTFLQRFGASIHGVLSGFDRVRFRGTQRLLANLRGMACYLSMHSVLLKDFARFAQEATANIKRDVTAQATALDRPVVYLADAQRRKEDVARQLADRYHVREGLIGILSAVEPCRSFTVGPNRASQRLELRLQPTKCLHYYHYWLDPLLGLCHVRLQTWLPYTAFVCINGREILARQLNAAGIDFVQRDNCFAAVADVPRAQALLDAQVSWDWSAQLQRLVTASHPNWQQWPGMERPYYWSAEEMEWATDVMVRSRPALASLMPRFLRHGLEVLHSADVMRFLGRKVPGHGGVNGRFAGEVETHYAARPEGVRLRHRLNRNVVKLYDKQGSVLRIEAVTNDPRDLKVYRAKEGDPEGTKAWRPLRKGVADLPRRAEVSQKSTERYLESLATLEESRPLGALTDRVCRRTYWQGRPVRALQPLAAPDRALLEAVGRGEFLLHGFRNRDLRRLLYAEAAGDAAQCGGDAAIAVVASTLGDPQSAQDATIPGKRRGPNAADRVGGRTRRRHRQAPASRLKTCAWYKETKRLCHR